MSELLPLLPPGARPLLCLGLWLATVIVGLGLRILNLRHLQRHGGQVPAGFEAQIDAATLARARDYTVAGSRLGLWESLWGDSLVLWFFFGGLLPCYERWVVGTTGSFLGDGVLFLLGLVLARTVLELPFGLWRTFRLEARFGFNATTPGLWLADLVKSLLISGVLLGGLTAGALALVRARPGDWWLWVWLLLTAAAVLLLYLSPLVIEPLFFKFTAVRRAGLEAGIRELAARAGLQVSAVRQVDASRRSGHSNAYFTGIGRVKRIVLFDTLLEKLRDDEILAVLAHEMGHWRYGHVRRRLTGLALLALAGCWLSWRLFGWQGLPELLGLAELTIYGRFTLIFFLAGIIGFFLTPLLSSRSRRQEWQADRYAVALSGHPEALAAALVKLSRDNLANLYPHPWYAAWYASHPPVVQRVARLRTRD